MRWYVKSLIFKAVSILPGGSRLYNFSQQKISRSTDATPARVQQKLTIGFQYWDWLKQHGRTDALVDGAVLDYGAGWHPTIPFLFYRLGARRQALLDVSPLLNDQLVVDTLEISRKVMSDQTFSGYARPLAGSGSMNSIFKELGIEYFAPHQESFKSGSESFNAVFSTQVLQHIPEFVMVAVFKEVFSWLKPGGLFMATTHLTFQFGTPDTNARQYQHLSISPRIWQTFFSSRIMYFNRFKGPDYRRTLEAAGFRIVEMLVTPPSTQDSAYFNATRIHECFRHLRPEELAARHVFFVAEKPIPARP